MMRRRKRLTAFGLVAAIGTLLCMDTKMLLQVAEGGEYFLAHVPVTVERFAVVQPQVSPEPVPRVERLLAVTLGTLERLDFVVDPHVNLQRVAGQKRLPTILLAALELEFTFVRFDMCPQVTSCTIVAITRLIDALISWFLSGKEKKQDK